MVDSSTVRIAANATDIIPTNNLTVEQYHVIDSAIHISFIIICLAHAAEESNVILIGKIAADARDDIAVTIINTPEVPSVCPDGDPVVRTHVKVGHLAILQASFTME